MNAIRHIPKMQPSSHVLESLTYAVASIGASTVAIVQARFDPDIVSVLGAILAAVVAVMEARKKDRSLSHTVSVFLCSSGFGAVLPGGMMWTFFPDRVPNISWHLWALMGGVGGLLGWAFALGIMAIGRWLPGVMSSQAKRYIPGSTEDQEP
jgi:hypothetical protein